MISEVNSLLESINWKMHHKKNQIEVKRSDILLEWIDIFKYWLSIGLVWDFTPQEFVSAFDEKSSLVEQRYLQEFSEIEGRDIVICDIDGVLSDYPATFIDYIVHSMSISKEYSEKLREKFMSEPLETLDLYKYFEGVLPTAVLKQLKHNYRSEGHIRLEKVTSGAKEFLSKLREHGDYIVILTSRPFDRYKSLYLDTYMWLKDNGLEFDMLLCDSKKRDKITKILETSNVKFLIDDDPKIIKGIEGIDKLNKIYLMDRDYNKELSDTDKVKRVRDFNEILKKEMID